MRVLVSGATGLIGAAVVARLHGDGHEVIGLARRLGPAARGLPAARWIGLDFARATRPQDWTPHLAGIDAVVNCAGVFQDAPGVSTADVHHRGAAALFAACEAAGVRRVIQVSAMGVEGDNPTAFSRTKQAGDADLMGRDLDWVILRPSVVVGRAAYGGSALFRGLAALPWAPEVQGTGLLQIVQADEVAATVAHVLDPTAPGQTILELAGPERLSFDEVIAAYRAWLGWPPARRVWAPKLLTDLAFRLGDVAGWLGWRPPIRTTAAKEIARGAVGDPTEWMRLTGLRPARLADALAASPASVQERWFARLYLLKAAVFACLSLFWIVTGLITLGPAYEGGRSILEGAGAGALGGPLTIAGALADLAIGVGIALRRTARPALLAALGVSLVYALGAAVLAPQLWTDPLGPMVKILPILLLNLVALAILEDR